MCYWNVFFRSIFSTLRKNYKFLLSHTKCTQEETTTTTTTPTTTPTPTTTTTPTTMGVASLRKIIDFLQLGFEKKEIFFDEFN